MKKSSACLHTPRTLLALLTLLPLLFAADYPDALGVGRPASGEMVKIGTITQAHPTISSLLNRDPKLKNRSLDIINALQNRDKDYSRIQPGTDIYYNPATKELLWADTASKKAPVAVIPETAFEFPAAVEGEKITHDFIIQNRGEGDLVILDVKTT